MFGLSQVIICFATPTAPARSSRRRAEETPAHGGGLRGSKLEAAHLDPDSQYSGSEDQGSEIRYHRNIVAERSSPVAFPEIF